MHRNKSVNVHQFTMIPKADIPRSKFDCQSAHKTTFDAGYLVPVYVDEVLPGDTFNLKMTAFARLSTPLYPIMDNMVMDSFFFFIPNRLVWDNWEKFMGQQDNPDDSIDYVIPQQTSPEGGYAIGSLQDYMGLPTVGQMDPTKTIDHCAFFTRAYYSYGTNGSETKTYKTPFLYIKAMLLIQLQLPITNYFVVANVKTISHQLYLGHKKAMP